MPEGSARRGRKMGSLDTARPRTRNRKTAPGPFSGVCSACRAVAVRLQHNFPNPPNLKTEARSPPGRPAPTVGGRSAPSRSGHDFAGGAWLDSRTRSQTPARFRSKVPLQDFATNAMTGRSDLATSIRCAIVRRPVQFALDDIPAVFFGFERYVSSSGQVVVARLRQRTRSGRWAA